VQAPALVIRLPPLSGLSVDPSGEGDVEPLGFDAVLHPEPFHSHHCPCALSAKRLPPSATSISVAEPAAADCPSKRIRLPNGFVVLLNVQAPMLVCKFPDCPTVKVEPSGDKAGGAADSFHAEPFHCHHWPWELSA